MPNLHYLEIEFQFNNERETNGSQYFFLVQRVLHLFLFHDLSNHQVPFKLSYLNSLHDSIPFASRELSWRKIACLTCSGQV